MERVNERSDEGSPILSEKSEFGSAGGSEKDATKGNYVVKAVSMRTR